MHGAPCSPLAPGWGSVPSYKVLLAPGSGATLVRLGGGLTAGARPQHLHTHAGVEGGGGGWVVARRL